MTQEDKEKSGLQLDVKDAQVSTFGNVNIYQWDSKISGNSGHTWWANVGRSVVSGGIHVKGWNRVYMTDSYPVDANTWKIGSYNAGSGSVDVTLYIVALS